MRATFALLCYNQQNMVRAAIAGVLAQTVSVEIIVSDDCSTDDTWAVIQDELRGYAGRHTVKAVRQPTNLGLPAHVDQIIRAAAGDVVIIAAGDDVSIPERAERTLEAFDADGRLSCLGSMVSADGVIESPLPVTADSALSAVRQGLPILGASLAFRKAALLPFMPLPTTLRSCEDVVLPFRAGLMGNVDISPHALVNYHRHPDSITGRAGMAARSAQEFANGLRRVVSAMALARSIQIADAQFAASCGYIDQATVAALVKTISTAAAREAPMHALLFRQRGGLRLCAAAFLSRRYNARETAKTLFMGLYPEGWYRYLNRRSSVQAVTK